MSLIVDASVALKWGVEEEGSDRAHALLAQSKLLAPDLVAAEVANALWKKQRRGELGAGQFAAALAAAMRGYDELTPASDLAFRALELAVGLDQPAYDCFYLALAEARASELITADKRLLVQLQNRKWQGAYRLL